MRSGVAVVAVVLSIVGIVGPPVAAQQTPSQSQPDLVAVSVEVDPAGAQPGESAEIVAVVENRGSADADGFFARVRINGAIRYAELMSGLAAGERRTWRMPWLVEADADELTLEVDATDRVAESDETNNERTTAISFAADLQISELTLDPQFPQPGEDVQVRVTVRNPSTLDVSETFAVEIRTERGTATTRFVQGLEAGASDLVTASWTAEAGPQLIQATVDSFERIPESDADNNRAFLAVDVTERRPTGADLAITEVRMEPDRPDVGQNVSLQATVANVGTGAASAFDVGFWADGESVGRASIPQLGAGESTVVSLAWMTRAGQQRLRALADAGHVVAEADEANNGGALTVDLGPDLNACGQRVYLWLQDNAVDEFMAIVGQGPEAIRNLWLPRVKRVMETQYEGINVRFVYERPREGYGTVAIRQEDESPILGRAPIGGRFSTGNVYLGSFLEFGLGSFAVSRIPILVGTVASHELGHMFGLRHPSPSTGGIMDANTQLTPIPGDDVPRFRAEAREQLESLLPLACTG